MDRSDKDAGANFISLGEFKTREELRRKSYEVLNDLITHADKHGAGPSEVDDLRNSFEAFQKAGILRSYDSKVWTMLISRLESDVSSYRDLSGESVKVDPVLPPSVPSNAKPKESKRSAS